MEYKALIVEEKEDRLSASIQILKTEDLVGDVTIKVAYASVNYKDGLATIPDSGVVGAYPVVVGLDFTGVVVETQSERFNIGDSVIVTSHDILKYQHGGFAEYACVPEHEVTHCPSSLTLKQAAIIGTAGYTAALAIYRMMQNTNPVKRDPILVLGASGGVGSMACSILKRLNYPVTAVSSKHEDLDFFTMLGVENVIPPESILENKPKALASMNWGGVIDPVGGPYISHILPQVKQEGVYCLCGNTAGFKIETTVFPFILRGVQLIGIDSVHCTLRDVMWELIATEFRPVHIHSLIDEEIELESVPRALEKILSGSMKGRTIVKL